MKITYIDEKRPLGTAGCLYFLKNKIKKPLFVTNGDVLTALDFHEMFKSHNNHKADLICFGRPFIGNPDLVNRLFHGQPLTEAPMNTWYGGDAHGYIDWPCYDAILDKL